MTAPETGYLECCPMTDPGPPEVQTAYQVSLMACQESLMEIQASLMQNQEYQVNLKDYPTAIQELQEVLLLVIQEL